MDNNQSKRGHWSYILEFVLLFFGMILAIYLISYSVISNEESVIYFIALPVGIMFSAISFSKFNILPHAYHAYIYSFVGGYFFIGCMHIIKLKGV